MEPYIERNISKIEVGDILVADGHVLNFQVINPFTGSSVRATLVGFFDWKSGTLAGYEIMMSENTQCIASALRNSIINLGKIPKIVYQDNGRAFRAKYFQHCDFNCKAIGLTKKSVGGICKSQKNYTDRIDDIHKRLDTVIIEHLDFEELIKYYDFEGAFFYCDPPYSKGYKYSVQKGKFDHERLFNVLKNIKGRFLLSYNDCPEIKELYKDFEIIEFERSNSINNKTVGGHIKETYKELLIANYPIKL